MQCERDTENVDTSMHKNVYLRHILREPVLPCSKSKLANPTHGPSRGDATSLVMISIIKTSNWSYDCIDKRSNCVRGQGIHMDSVKKMKSYNL